MFLFETAIAHLIYFGREIQTQREYFLTENIQNK